MATGVENRQAVFSWLNTFLRDRNLQLTRSGFKGGADLGKHTIDVATGNWGDVAYSSVKPLRWLFQVDITVQPVAACLPGGANECSIGGSNTAQGDKAALAVRILPLIQSGIGGFAPQHDFEVTALFVFHGALVAGSSADAIYYNIETGSLSRVFNGNRQDEPYIFAALLGLRSRADQENYLNGSVTYGEVMDAIQAAIMVHPLGGAAGPIEAYDLSDDNEVVRLTSDLETAWDASGPPPEAVAEALEVAAEDEGVLEIDVTTLDVPMNPNLLGVNESVYRQINALLRSGKQHIMLYGPPGTGKTTLARWIASSLPGGQWTLVTGSSDWSSQDIIGGYQPVGNGNVDFVAGVLLRNFDRPFIIDELNRCDIDKVIGPLFTVLSGQQTTLPYRTDLTNVNSQPYVILPQPKAGAADHEFAPGPAWRLIATINSIDKASLYQMSYALSRRFGWVYVDAPADLAGFITEYLAKAYPAELAPVAGAVCPLAEVWAAINSARVIGSAPIIDAIAAIRELAPGEPFFGLPSNEMREAALDALDMVLLPMLDGIVLQEAINIADATVAAFGLAPEQAARVRTRLEAVAI
jgi:MoxR-like ATPase